MKFARALLAVNSAMFIGLGVWVLLAPSTVAAFVTFNLSSPTARAEFLAFYGGFELGFGLFLAACVTHPAWLQPGLLALGLALFCTGAARAYGIATAGPVQENLVQFMVFELAVAPVCFIAARRLGSTRPSSAASE